MQEEVTGKSVALIISSAKMTEQVLDRAIRAYLDRKKQPKIYRGKQTLMQLAGQNAGLSNIEITEKNIRCFTQTAKKYHVDFALKKDTASEHNVTKLAPSEKVKIGTRTAHSATEQRLCAVFLKKGMTRKRIGKSAKKSYSKRTNYATL